MMLTRRVVMIGSKLKVGGIMGAFAMTGGHHQNQSPRVPSPRVPSPNLTRRINRLSGVLANRHPMELSVVACG